MPPRSTRTDTLFPDPTLFRSHEQISAARVRHLCRAGTLTRRAAVGRRCQSWHPADVRSTEGIIGALFLRFFRKSLWPDGRSAIHRFSASRGQVRDDGRTHRSDRSEEHTSELQSLMRISYAVFCLKNKKY